MRQQSRGACEREARATSPPGRDALRETANHDAAIGYPLAWSALASAAASRLRASACRLGNATAHRHKAIEAALFSLLRLVRYQALGFRSSRLVRSRRARLGVRATCAR